MRCLVLRRKQDLEASWPLTRNAPSSICNLRLLKPRRLASRVVFERRRYENSLCGTWHHWGIVPVGRRHNRTSIHSARQLEVSLNHACIIVGQLYLTKDLFNRRQCFPRSEVSRVRDPLSSGTADLHRHCHVCKNASQTNFARHIGEASTKSRRHAENMLW